MTTLSDEMIIIDEGDINAFEKIDDKAFIRVLKKSFMASADLHKINKLAGGKLT